MKCKKLSVGEPVLNFFHKTSHHTAKLVLSHSGRKTCIVNFEIFNKNYSNEPSLLNYVEMKKI